ncbi:MAG TPA: gephyrin-like molybdotransferase Glp [Polyangia bacterium]|jgi:molybdopterin molybdotransferase
MAEILSLRSPAEAHALLGAFPPVGTERVALADALDRVLAAPFAAPADTPPFARATMDGYAVRAADLAAAAPDRPARLTVRGAVPMGGALAVTLAAGDAAAITTGGVLPQGADAVVMIEETRPAGAGVVAVLAPSSPWHNVIRPGEDLTRGELLIPGGRRLRPQDLGLLASFGVLAPEVRRQPRVGLLASGDELVPPDRTPGPGQIRDVNQTVLAAQVRRAGALPEAGGIVADDPGALGAALRDLLGRCDVVLMSGGSSVGSHDFAATVIAGLGGPGVLFHGINVRPGKPTLCARIGDRAVIGMPGHPVSSMVIFDVFIRPFLARLGGETPRDPWPARRQARLAAAVRSAAGRTEYVRVRLHPPVQDELPLAEPLAGGSAAFGTVVRADGLVEVPEDAATLAAGTEVEVLLY